jgi:hypothetical protein
MISKIHQGFYILKSISILKIIPAKESFDKEIHFFTTDDDVQNHNKIFLRNLNYPIATNVTTRGENTYYMETNEEYLELKLLITTGARVMCT